MVRTRNQLRIEENEEIEMVAKYIKTDEEIIEAEAMEVSFDLSLSKLSPSSSNLPYYKTDSIPLKSLLNSLKSNGMPLPRILKRLRNVVELVESDDMEGSVMMMIYLHNTNYDSEHFVKHVFIDQGFLEIVRKHFVLWTADMSMAEDKIMLEKEIEENLSMDVVELLRQYQKDQFPLLMVVSWLNGKHQVLKVFTGVKDVKTLNQELAESILIHKELMVEQEDEGEEKTDVGGSPTVEDSATFPLSQKPVLVQLQVGQFVHLAEFRAEQTVRDLLQYVAANTGLKIGQFSLSSLPGTDLTLLWNCSSFTLDMIGMKGGMRTTLRINKK